VTQSYVRQYQEFPAQQRERDGFDPVAEGDRDDGVAEFVQCDAGEPFPRGGPESLLRRQSIPRLMSTKIKVALAVVALVLVYKLLIRE
jgi:hypothetical protein